jgi:hypothetical protein
VSKHANSSVRVCCVPSEFEYVTKHAAIRPASFLGRDTESTQEIQNYFICALTYRVPEVLYVESKTIISLIKAKIDAVLFPSSDNSVTRLKMTEEPKGSSRKLR